jgi:hypothetical protein
MSAAVVVPLCYRGLDWMGPADRELRYDSKPHNNELGSLP